MGCLERCSPTTFQPSQLFPLFPTYTAAWAQQVGVQAVRVGWQPEQLQLLPCQSTVQMECAYG